MSSSIAEDMLSRILVLTGPTASGKTTLAIAVAKRLNAEIVSADSVQVYQHLDVGSAKPTVEERCGVPHHLLSVVSPLVPFSVVDYVKLAEAAIVDILARGKVALVCGGTGLYLESLFSGHTHAAPPDEGFREGFWAELETLGQEALYDRLRALDPQTAAQVHPHNHVRVMRALEILHLTGAPMPHQAIEFLPVPMYALDWPRPALLPRIEARVDTMLRDGLVEETRRLLNMGIGWESQALHAVGYRQLRPYLQGEATLPQARERIIIATRQYAKRQMTWFRNRLPQAVWIPAHERAVEAIAENIAADFWVRKP